MRSGLLNERLQLYTITQVRGENGAVSPTETLKGEYWCRVLHASYDRNENDVERVLYNPNIRFELRASVPVAKSDMIKYNGDNYVITMIDTNHNFDIQTLYVERYE